MTSNGRAQAHADEVIAAEPLEAEGRGQVQRRGLLAGGAALAGAAVAKLAGADQAGAGHNSNIVYDSQTVMHVDVVNTTAASSRISSNISGTAPFVVLNDYPTGISRPDGMLGRTGYATSNCAGVAGASQAPSGGIGVMGCSNAADGTGVYGNAGSVVPSTVAPAGTGVFGRGPNHGVIGRAAAAGVGVQGESSELGTGVQGFATDGGTAVRGDATGGASSIGVDARGETNGVVGTSASGTGARGETVAGVGVLGLAGAAGTAGRFVGRTVVEGALEVVGGPVTTDVPAPGGSRRMFATLASEPWLEDFGEAKLKKNGRALVELRPEFAALIAGADYQVFLTEYRNTGGLYVSGRTESGFKVRARSKRKGRFGYRVVARRADVVAARLRKAPTPAPTPEAGGREPERPAAPRYVSTPAVEEVGGA